MKVAIIGGGACGLVVANVLQKNNISYTIYEKNKVGKKILASGNGKANIYNTNLFKTAYNNRFAYDLVKEKYLKMVDFFTEIGLYTKTDLEGRTYPYSESSQTVLNCLIKDLKNLKEEYNIETIVKKNNKYYLNSEDDGFDYLVLATGSMAGMIKSKQTNYNAYLDSLNIKTTKLYPSLVGFKLADYPKSLSGVRVKVKASLYQKTKLIHEELGEVIFKDDGISGICILNLSFYYNQLNDKKNCQIVLDLIPTLDIKDIDINNLDGLLNVKLAKYLSNIKDPKNALKNLSFDILAPYDFEFCQVISGGISLKDINYNLSLKTDENIFIGGELLDVDGVCGGYNLMFAFCSGLLIGEELCNIK